MNAHTKNVHHKHFNRDEVKSLAKDWGWIDPPREIEKLAEKCLAATGKKVGEILASWGVLEPALVDRLLKNKPADVHTLQYFSEKEPSRVLQAVEQLLALQNGHAFYERLSLLTPHALMGMPAVIKACKEVDAVLMLVEGKVPVLVFSRWDSMLAYSMIGNAQRQSDPIFVSNQRKMPLFAVGARDDISALLKLHEVDHDGGAISEVGARAWNVKSTDAGTPHHERELARIFDHALSVGASDVAFKPLRDGSVEVRVRKWGRLVEPFKYAKGSSGAERGTNKTVLSPDIASKAINLLLTKSMAGDFTQLREPKDGQINYKSSTADAFMRLSFIPLNHLGEYKDLRSVSVRLFTRTEVTIRLNDLNIPPDAAEHIRDAVQMPQGLLLLSGPTNSGKSSTIAAAVGEHVEFFGDDLKRLSVEDPVERHLAGITQVNVPMHVEEGKRFSTVLKGLHRHDLDLLWVGEVRDRESAEFCVNFSVTGHLGLSTIHAKDSIGAYDNLSLKVLPEMRFQVVEAMALSVAQRLIKGVCPKCSQRGLVPTKDEVHAFELNKKMTGETEPMPELVTRITRVEGCDECDRGYKEELPICEVLPFTRAVKDAALSRLFGDDPKKQREIMANARAITLLQSGLRVMAEGRTDLASILFY